MRYAIWNNKGGVGKSFLTFILASEYASQNPQKHVYVIDMCPQANVSEIFLGGDGKGAEKLAALLEVGANRKTIGGYFDSRIDPLKHVAGKEADFCRNIHEDNEHIPKNLYLVAGDPSLEIQVAVINQIAAQSLPKEIWKTTHSWLLDLCDALPPGNEGVTCFIDCNPSFAAYTELSLIAADKLIVPCTADGSSARAIDNIAQLVYGKGIPEQYDEAAFYARLKREHMSPPCIGFVILNRSTQYNRKASKAFGAMFSEIKSRVKKLIESTPKAGDDGKKADEYFLEVPDTHSVSIVASNKGLPLNEIKVGPYQVADERPQVNQEPLNRYKDAIGEIVKKL